MESSPVCIESFQKRGVCVASVIFVSIIAVFAILGAAGPTGIFVSTRETKLSCLTENCTAIWKVYLTDMSALNQAVYLQGRVIKQYPTELSFSYMQTLNVTAFGILEDGTREELVSTIHERSVSCPAGTTSCDAITVFAQSFIEYPKYYVQVEFIHPHAGMIANRVQGGFDVIFSMIYGSKAFTTYEIGIKVACLAVSFIVLCVYWWRLLRVPVREWTYEQRWIACLLIALLGFNDPLFLIVLYSGGIAVAVVSIVLIVTFLAAMLLFWLCVLDVVRLSASSRTGTVSRGWKFMLPKAILVGIFHIATICVYSYLRVQQLQDPSFSSVDDFEHFSFFKVLAVIVVAIYCVWIVVLMISGFKGLKLLSWHFVLIFLLSFGAIVLCMTGLFLGAYSPFPLSTLIFAIFYGTFNVYLWVLAGAYLPVRGFGHHDMELVEDHELAGIVFESATHTVGIDTETHDVHNALESGFSRNSKPASSPDTSADSTPMSGVATSSRGPVGLRAGMTSAHRRLPQMASDDDIVVDDD